MNRRGFLAASLLGLAAVAEAGQAGASTPGAAGRSTTPVDNDRESASLEHWLMGTAKVGSANT